MSKNGIIYIISHYFSKINVDSYDYLPYDSFRNYFLNSSVLYYYCKMFLKKCTYQLAKT